jgi:hypothetical protein
VALTIGVTMSYRNGDFTVMYIFLAWGVVLALRFRYGPGVQGSAPARTTSMRQEAGSPGSWRFVAGFLLTVAGLCGIAYAIVNNILVFLVPAVPVYVLGHWLRHQARALSREEQKSGS